MSGRFHSIRWRLQWWYGLLLGAVITTLATSFYLYERDVRLARADAELSSAVGYLIPRLIPPGLGDRPRRRPPAAEGRERPLGGAPAARRPYGQDPGGASAARGGPPQLVEGDLDPLFYWIAWTGDGELIRQSANVPDGVPIPEDASTRTLLRTRGEFREAYHQIPRGNSVLAGVSRDAVVGSLRSLKIALATGGGVVFLAIMVPAWWLTGRTLRPIQTISESADRIINGDYSERIDTGGVRSELGQLAGILNESFARLDEARKQQLRFTADASHELRTPLSVIIADGEFALRRDRDSEHYRKTIHSSVASALHMREVIEGLMEISRLDTLGIDLETEETDLSSLAAECVELLAPLARSAELSFRLELGIAPCEGHCPKLRQVIINLLGNAIQHSPSSGWIAVRTGVSPDEKSVFLTVEDSGDGIAAEDLPYVFQRFYRSDSARSDSSRTGLGLAITRAIVEAHAGSIRAESPAGMGGRLTVEMPRR